MVNPQPPTPSTQENKTESSSVRPLELWSPGVPGFPIYCPRNLTGGGPQQPPLRCVPPLSIQCGSGSPESVSPPLLPDLSHPPHHLCLPPSDSLLPLPRLCTAVLPQLVWVRSSSSLPLWCLIFLHPLSALSVCLFHLLPGFSSSIF